MNHVCRPHLASGLPTLSLPTFVGEPGPKSLRPNGTRQDLSGDQPEEPIGSTDGPSATTAAGTERGLSMVLSVRLGAFVLGLTCAALGCYGAWEFALKLEAGTVTYLVLAAPVIAAAAAMIPPLAEATWRGGHYLKALL
jgi:hypothetical protein